MKIIIENEEFFADFLVDTIVFELDYIRVNDDPEEEDLEIEKILYLIDLLRQMDYLDMPLDDLNPDNIRERLLYLLKFIDLNIGERFLQLY
jgi:hypothetical protein